MGQPITNLLLPKIGKLAPASISGASVIRVALFFDLRSYFAVVISACKQSSVPKTPVPPLIVGFLSKLETNVLDGLNTTFAERPKGDLVTEIDKTQKILAELREEVLKRQSEHGANPEGKKTKSHENIRENSSMPRDNQ